MAADTYSDTLGFLTMGTGNDNNTWGSNANNSVFQIFEDAIANALSSAVSGGTLDLSGSPPPAGPSQVHYAALIFTGVLTANQIVKVPNLTKWWWVNNQTSGSFYLSIITNASGTVGTGSLLTLGTLTGGTSYTNGTYYNVPLTGGSGSGAEATIVVSGGAVTSVALTAFGQKYLATDTGLSASASNIGGTGSGFSVNAGTVGNLIPQNSGWQLVQCDGSGDVLVSPFNSEQIQMPDGSASAPSYSDINEPNSGLYRHGTQDWRFAVDGTDVLQITGPDASTPSVVNVVNGSLQQAGVQLVPPGTELAFAGAICPAGFLFEYGQAVSRTTYPNLLNALRVTFTGTTTNGSPTVTGLSFNFTNMGCIGAILEGTGVTGLMIAGTPSSSSITLSGNATASGTITIYAYPYGNGDGSTTFNVPDRRGRVIAGRDDMGGSVAGRLTAAGSGVTGYELAATGGGQNETASTTISQANLPEVNFTVSGIAVQTTVNSFSYSNNFSEGTTNFYTSGTNTGNSNNPSSGTINISTAVTNQGSAASGGSGTAATSAAFTTVQPTGMSNYIIKY